MRRSMRKTVAALAATALGLGFGAVAPAAFAAPASAPATPVAPAAAAPASGSLAGAASAAMPACNINVQSLHNYDAKTPMAMSADNLPSKFDLRADGGKDYVTPVKNQGGWGVCWSFATMASLESTMLKDGRTIDGKEPDLSELQLAWFASSPLSQATYDKTKLLTSPMNLKSQIGEGSSVLVNQGASEPIVSQVMNKGANYPDATAALASWQGATTEDDVPYSAVPNPYEPNYDPNEPGLDEAKRTDSVVHVQDVDYLPSPATFNTTIGNDKTDYTDNYVFNQAAQDGIKEALMNDGVVAFGYYSTGAARYFNNATSSQYVDHYITKGSDATMMNHAVAIVGWDDNYSKNNFGGADGKTGAIPPADGAWIVKNSWGDWGTDAGVPGENGYFYLSYYDMTISQPSVFHADVPADSSREFSYDNNYQYDFLGAASVAQIRPNAFGDKAQFANVFTAKGHESLDAVSATTTNPGSSVRYQVYLLKDGATSPTDGELKAEKTVSVEYGGYHTLKLDDPIELKAGDRFSVVETIDGRDGRYVPIEIAARDDNDPDESGTVHQKHQEAKIAPGESYLTTDNGSTWEDANSINSTDIDVSTQVVPSAFGGTYHVFSTGNMEIKAFTTDLAPEPEPEPTPASGTIAVKGHEVKDGKVDATVGDVLDMTATMPGDAPVTWTVSDGTKLELVTSDTAAAALSSVSTQAVRVLKSGEATVTATDASGNKASVTVVASDGQLDPGPTGPTKPTTPTADKGGAAAPSATGEKRMASTGADVTVLLTAAAALIASGAALTVLRRRRI